MVGEVAFGVTLQVARRRNPDVSPSTAREIIQDDARDLPPLSDARAVADHEPRPGTVRQTFEVLLARVRHALELQTRQSAGVDGCAERLVDRVMARRQRDGRKTRRLGDVAGMLDAALRVVMIRYRVSFRVVRVSRRTRFVAKKNDGRYGRTCGVRYACGATKQLHQLKTIRPLFSVVQAVARFDRAQSRVVR